MPYVPARFEWYRFSRNHLEPDKFSRIFFYSAFPWLAMPCLDVLCAQSRRNVEQDKMLYDLSCFNVINARRRFTLLLRILISIIYYLSHSLNSEKMIINNMIFIFDRFSCLIVLATSCCDQLDEEMRWIEKSVIPRYRGMEKFFLKRYCASCREKWASMFNK